MPLEVHFGRTAQDYSTYRQGFPEAFYQRLSGWGLGRPGQRILDLGTGTGDLARGFARKGCTVTALDPAPELLAAGARMAAEEGHQIQWVEATAEATGLPAAAFEVITAGQCWHWFDAAQASAEIQRLLVPNGVVVIGHFDWIPLPENVVWWTEQLIEKHNPDWHLGGRDGVYAGELTDLARAGFRELELFAFDAPTSYSHAAWRGRIRASAGIAASLTGDKVAAFDAELAQLLTQRFPEDPLSIPHRVSATIGRK